MSKNIANNCCGGSSGASGPQGPPGTNGLNATMSIGSVTTGAPGSYAMVTNTGTSTDHSIFTFFGDIKNLEEGTYKWDEASKKFVKQ